MSATNQDPVSSQAETNNEVFNSVITGNGHVYYGIIGIFAIGIIFVAGWFLKYNWLLGIALLLLATGIAVDLWSNGFTH